ncbi:hypothetical protein LXA47_01945 [Massilia sp. P8910]|uniref:hypothetical protein n=1 Tax=Massilia antarctica TaxID=2765360 RepID=UPI001E47CE46|nr:hypothetical protein [Massilia antarctica]MCE3602375.1 hypothetical protein [Massilia antarctica]
MSFFTKFFTRLREPSTMAGLSGLAVVFGATAAQLDATAQVVAGLLSVAAVFLPENKAQLGPVVIVKEPRA